MVRDHNKNYFAEIEPDKVHLYFDKSTLSEIKNNLGEQILTTEFKHLKEGQGIFVFDTVKTDQGLFKIAVHAIWECDIVTIKFKLLEITKYYLFSGRFPTGDLPDELLDHINSITTDKSDIEWKYGNNISRDQKENKDIDGKQDI